MPNKETQYLDEVIVSRRALLVGGGATLAALAIAPAIKQAQAQNAVGVYSDTDILNFALNLEYLESNFYYLAAFGTTIDVANASSMAAGAGVLGINGVTGNNSAGNSNGVVANTGVAGAPASNASYKVPFTTPAIAGYAVETAVEEGKHVAFLRSALGSLAVAQPAINITPALFAALANQAGVTAVSNFNPYSSEAAFLLGAYIFEDVGVSAYHGAAPLIVSKTGILPAAAGILAVEAYHAGLIRTSLTVADQNATYFATGTIATITGQLSAFRNSAAQAKAQVPANPEDPSPDDYGLATQMVTLNAGQVTATQIVDAPPLSATAPATAFARSTSQVLNIVTAGGAVAGSIAKGGFFPSGLNGLFI